MDDGCQWKIKTWNIDDHPDRIFRVVILLGGIAALLFFVGICAAINNS